MVNKHRSDSERFPLKSIYPGIINLILLSFFFLSGCSALIYEIVWLRKLVLIFGSTTFAISCILSSFMMGLGLGSFLIGRFIDRFHFDKSALLLIYTVIELAIGICGLSIPLTLKHFVTAESFLFSALSNSYYLYNIIIFILIFTLLIFPTILMGATFPVMSKIIVNRLSRKGSYFSLLYFINTFGGVIGIALCGFYLLPFKGINLSNLTAVSINFIITLASLLLYLAIKGSKRSPYFGYEILEEETGDDAGTAENNILQDSYPLPEGKDHSGLICVAIFTIGAISMILEITLTKYLALFLGPDTYAFSIMLLTFIMGIAIGSILAGLFINRLVNTLLAFGAFQVLIGVFCFLSVIYYRIIPWLYTVYFAQTIDYGIKSVLIKLSLCSLIMLIPAIMIGMLFPIALSYCTKNLNRMGSSIGKVYIFNSIGSVVGSFACAFLMIPVLGIQKTIYATIIINIAVGLVCILKATGFKVLSLFKFIRIQIGKDGFQPVWRIRFFPVSVVMLAAIICTIGIFFISEWNKGIMTAGPYVYADRDFYSIYNKIPPSFSHFSKLYEAEEENIIFYREGINTVVSVTRHSSGDLSLKVNGKVDAGTGSDMKDQILIAQIPMLIASSIHESLDKVLCIGFGSGVSLNVMSSYNVNELYVVELESAVLEAASYFEAGNDSILEKPNVTAIVNDGRNYLLLTENRFDVILSEPSNPFIPGAAKLFTREFYRMAKSRLSDEGIYAQWIPLYGFDETSFKSVLKAFVSEFPESLLFNYSRGSLVVLGFKQVPKIDVRKIKELFNRSRIFGFFTNKLVNVRNYHELFAMFNMGSREIMQYCADARENNDDNSLVEYLTPVHLYSPTRAILQESMKKYSSTIQPYLTNYGSKKEKSQLLLEIYRTLKNSPVNSELSNRYFHLALHDTDKADLDVSYFEINDTVRVRKEVETPINGWGNLKDRNSIGRITDILNRNQLVVRFPSVSAPLLFEKQELEKVKAPVVTHQ